VGISENSIHLLYITSGQIYVYTFASPVSMTYGIACKNIIDENTAEFFVKNKEEREIVVIRINKKYRTCEVRSRNFIEVSKWRRLGGIASQLGVYGLIGEMDTIYGVTEETEGYSHVNKTVILTGVPTVSFMFAMPFTVYGCSIPVAGSTSTYLTSILQKPQLIFRRYDKNGNFIENFRSLFMGNMQPGKKSDINIINMLVQNVSYIENVKLGIIQSDLNGNEVNTMVSYRISDVIDPNIDTNKYFNGINVNQISSDVNNIDVGVKTLSIRKNETNFIYLSINVPESYLGSGHLVFKWFFDYED